MKKQISLILTIASLYLILDTFNTGAALTAFLLTGVIPGTSIAISATAMMMFYALAAGFIFARIINTPSRHRLNSAN